MRISFVRDRITIDTARREGGLVLNGQARYSHKRKKRYERYKKKRNLLRRFESRDRQ